MVDTRTSSPKRSLERSKFNPVIDESPRFLPCCSRDDCAKEHVEMRLQLRGEWTILCVHMYMLLDFYKGPRSAQLHNREITDLSAGENVWGMSKFARAPGLTGRRT